MPKVNFNVPFTEIDGQPVQQVKFDYNNQKMDASGQLRPQVVKDENGDPTFETVMMKTIVINLLHANYPGDEALPGVERIARGKLASKVSRHNNVNYNTKELELIQTLAAKSQATPVLYQLDKLINGDDEAESAPEAGEAAAA